MRSRSDVIIRKPLLDAATLKIGSFEAYPASAACGAVERQSLNVVALPVSGVFAKHDKPGRYVVGTPNHAVLIAADTPYRISFPGAIGDRALIFRFDDALAPEELDTRSREGLSSCGLLAPDAIALRNLLWTRLQKEDVDAFEVEALGLDLLNVALRSMRRKSSRVRPAALARRVRALERVKEAVAAAPAAKWTIAGLGKIANVSPFHLSHICRQILGVSIYDYVLRERLAYALDPVVDSEGDLTAIALDAGFASHSHFTARFKTMFGCTPSALRRAATTGRIAEIRKIMTAQQRPPALD